MKPQKIMSLGSDGASVMTGTKTGISFNKKSIGRLEFVKTENVSVFSLCKLTVTAM